MQYHKNMKYQTNKQTAVHTASYNSQQAASKEKEKGGADFTSIYNTSYFLNFVYCL